MPFEAPDPNPQFDLDELRSFSRKALKEIAFMYHYGCYATEELAYGSFSYAAAWIMAERAGRKPRPANLIRNMGA